MFMTYQPSGYFKIQALVLVPVLSALLYLLTALPYSLAIHFCPYPLASPLLTLIWALAAAFLASRSIRLAKVRNPLLAVILVFIGIPAAYWALWAFRSGPATHLLAGLFLAGGPELFSLEDSFNKLWTSWGERLRNPSEVWEALTRIYQDGLGPLYSVPGTPLRGPLLALLWFLEFAGGLIPALILSARQAALPYDEDAGAWMKKIDLPRNAALRDKIDIPIEAIKKGDISYLFVAPIEADWSANSHLHLHLFPARSRSGPSFLSIYLYKFTGKNKGKGIVLCKLLAIRSKQAQALKAKYN